MSTTTVQIEVLDSNDEYPKFSKDQYTGHLKENMPPGQLVVQVTNHIKFIFHSIDAMKVNVLLLSTNDF